MVSNKSEQGEFSRYDAALQFVNSTSRNIFLTGKAGTGKTTFLKTLADRTHKQFIVVAPTGVAALNAGGTTIHSQFLLPLGSFLPDRSLSLASETEGVYNSNTLSRRHPLNSLRKKVLRSIDLLVIDEVSMLRADILDAIDYRLKSARGNYQKPFGGIQLLLIGDLYQLPPVVKRDEQALLRKYYRTAWFYESLALASAGFVYIEFDKIFRQHDDTFIRILNNLRDNKPTQEDIETLNQHYKSEEEIARLKEVVTLTTHNYLADQINLKALRELKTESHFFEAVLDGEFPENLYPAQSNLELKVGAQVMFIRNDSEGHYFNGKLATVARIDDGSVVVLMADSHEEYQLKVETWENKRYTVSADSQHLNDEVIGTFQQFPVKLAWAITVHKSQGLTFDKAIIDVGRAFADGQVYVALSRLRSLDGLILRTRIDSEVISTDTEIVSFAQKFNRPGELESNVKQGQHEYIIQVAENTFDFKPLVKQLQSVTQSRNETPTLSENMKPVLEQLQQTIEAETENTTKYIRQLTNLIQTGDQNALITRLEKGSDYYRELIIGNLKVLLLHMQEMKQRKKVKTYLNQLSELDQLLVAKLGEISRCPKLVEDILAGKSHFDFNEQKKLVSSVRTKILNEVEAQVPVKAAKAKGKRKGRKGKQPDELSTYDITLQMFNNGMSIEEIARDRELVAGTIEGHLAKLVETGRVDISRFVSPDELNVIATAIGKLPEGFTSKDLFAELNGRFGYGKLRAVMTHLKDSNQ